MTDTSNTQAINNAVKQIYLADIESIRNLSAVTTKLQAGQLTIPGDLNVSGNLKIDGKFNYLPKGVVVAWSGTVAPGGWTLCDGSITGVPDLRGRFILGSGPGRTVNSTGGAEVVTLSVAQMPAHNHSIAAGGAHSHKIPQGDKNWHSGNGNSAWGGSYTRPTSTDGHHSHDMGNSGGNQPHENMPPFYVLAYIYKL